MTLAESIILAFAGVAFAAGLLWRYVYCPLRELYHGDGGTG